MHGIRSWEFTLAPPLNRGFREMEYAWAMGIVYQICTFHERFRQSGADASSSLDNEPENA